MQSWFTVTDMSNDILSGTILQTSVIFG